MMHWSLTLDACIMAGIVNVPCCRLLSNDFDDLVNTFVGAIEYH
jgi:hypothetical protein